MGNIFSPDNIGGDNINAGEISPDYITAILGRMAPFREREEDRERAFQREMLQLQQKGQLENIARQMQGRQVEQQERPMNYAYQPSISEYQRGTLGLREQELRQKGELGRGSLDIRQQLAENPELLQNIRGNQALEQIAARLLGQKEMLGTRGEQGVNLQQMRGIQGMEQIGARGTQQESLQKMRGEQRLGEIEATGGQARETQAEKPILELSPTQERARQNNAIRKLVNTRPELSQFLKANFSGGYDVIPPSSRGGPTQEQFNEINQIIFGRTEDITLKPQGTKPATVKTPVKPVVAPVKSKYKLSIQ